VTESDMPCSKARTEKKMQLDADCSQGS